MTNDKIDDAFDLAQEAKDMARAVETKQTAHEILCTERWTQSRLVMDEVRADMKLLIQNLNQQAGAVKFGKALYAIIGAFGAAAVWIASHITFMR